MSSTQRVNDSKSDRPRRPVGIAVVEVAALVALFFLYAGDPPPAVNEAHYLVKAKQYWDSAFCAQDVLLSSDKAHTTFYFVFGVLTRWMSLDAAAWIGRAVGWAMIAIGLRRCCRSLELPAFSSLGVAILWIVGVEYANLAGEWVIGGIEAKVPAYGLVLIGLSEIIRRKWSRAWVWFGAASAFHVLTGGWAVIAAFIAFVVTERLRPGAVDGSGTGSGTVARRPLISPGLFIGGALSLFGLVPAIQLTLAVSPEQSTEAAQIYTYVRLPHHLLPGAFPMHWYLRHAVLVLGLLSVARGSGASEGERRLIWIGLGSLAIAIIGLVIGMLPALAPDLAAKLLRYYWFRLSDAMIPLVLVFWLVGRVYATDAIRPGGSSVWAKSIVAAGVVLFSASVLGRMFIVVPPSTSYRLLGIHLNASPDQQLRSHQDWVAVCEWIRNATPADEVFLTPRHQQSFKWYAWRAEVVNWKDVPQDAKSLLEWEKRFDDVFPKRMGTVAFNSMRVPINYSKLRQYRQRYGVRFMVVDNRIATTQLPLVKVYPVADQSNQTYSVYELPYD